MLTVTQKIKTGYKQTELGVIPEDWDVITYGKAFDFLRTAQYSREQLSDNGKTSYVHYGDIHTKWNYFLDLKNDLPKIKENQIKDYDLIKDCDLIMADASEDYEGICKSVEVKNTKEKKVISGLHTFLLRDKDNNFVDGFRGYIHTNKLVKSSMDRYATGLKVYGVSKTNLKLIQIPKPPKPEQTAIATVLSDADALIKKLEELIEKKKNIKQGTMQELLTGKKRLPGFSGKWEVKKLSDICGKITTGRLNANAMVDGGEYRFYTCAKDYYQIDRYAFNAEALLVSGNGANVGYIHYYKGKFNAYQRTYVLSDFSADIQYIKLFMDRNLQERIRVEVNAGNTPYITMGTLTEMQIMIPPTKDEQVAIANVLSEMDAEIEKLESQLVKYQNIKQGMMQQLLTGKIRIYGNK